MERMEINLSIMTKDQLKKFIVELEKENKSLKANLELVRRHRNGLEEENKKLKEDLEWYQQHYGAKPITTLEELKNHKGHTIWL